MPINWSLGIERMFLLLYYLPDFTCYAPIYEYWDIANRMLAIVLLCSSPWHLVTSVSFKKWKLKINSNLT